MPKKRTRQQKIRAQYHYAMPVGRSFTGVTVNEEDHKAVPAIRKGQDILSLYSYDPAYIVRDIRWTLGASFVILIVQFGLYFWLK